MAFVALAGCGSPAAPAQFAGATMGTTYHVTVTAADTPARREAVQAAIDTVLQEVDRTLSTYRDDSELARLNRAASRDWISVSPDLWQVLQLADEVSRATGGAFDITVAPLLDAWGFGAADTGPGAVLVPPTPRADRAGRCRPSATGGSNCGTRPCLRCARPCPACA